MRRVLELFPSQDNLTLNRTINLGKFGSFVADALLGQPYGLTYEIANKTINVIPPPAVEELGKRIFFLLRSRSIMWTQRIPMRQMNSSMTDSLSSP